jgi:hypothetical protein
MSNSECGQVPACPGSDAAAGAEGGGPASFQRLLEQAFNPEVLSCLQDVDETLSFDLPPSERQSFLAFHDFITNPQPRFITEWRASPRDEKWYHALVNGLNFATRNAYAAVLYHFHNLSRLETEVMEKLARRNYAGVVGNSTVALGNTLKWDFEYQAFVLAYRRCLDYLTRGLAAFFKQTFHSFNSMQKSLEGVPHQSVARALAAVHQKHRASFDFVISKDGERSTRDKIAHYEWVPAGTINLSRSGFVLVGGGEDLQFMSGHNKAQLMEALALRVRMLKDCIDEMLNVFVAEARRWDTAR